MNGHAVNEMRFAFGFGMILRLQGLSDFLVYGALFVVQGCEEQVIRGTEAVFHGV